VIRTYHNEDCTVFISIYPDGQKFGMAYLPGIRRIVSLKVDDRDYCARILRDMRASGRVHRKVRPR